MIVNLVISIEKTGIIIITTKIIIITSSSVEIVIVGEEVTMKVIGIMITAINLIRKEEGFSILI